jgi:uncharacterized repeat protein (TIGR03803 family)
VLGWDQALYGTTLLGGANGTGSVFRLFQGGVGYSQLYSITNGSDGDLPLTELTRCPSSASTAGPTGVFFGTTQTGGINGGGTLFALQINLPPTLTPVGNQSIVVWPAWAQKYMLQTTTNLSTGPWVTVTNYAPLVGAQLTNLATPNAFFRLTLPP